MLHRVSELAGPHEYSNEPSGLNDLASQGGFYFMELVKWGICGNESCNDYVCAAEILGALLSIAIIWVMTGVFIYLAVLRIIHQDFVIKADTMMIVAAIGVVFNIV